MVEYQVNRLSLTVWFATIGLGVFALTQSSESVVVILVGAISISLAQVVTVPAPSGEQLPLGIGIGVAVPLIVDEVGAVIAIYALGMAGSWVVFAFRQQERIMLSSRFVSEALALAAFGGVFYGVEAIFRTQGQVSDWSQLFGVAAAGIAWYVVRAFLRSLVGFERDDISARYLWLLALEDWTAVVSLFVAGALFGFAWPVMGAWAVLVSLLPYAFSHLAFVRYHSTKVTYGQTILALAQIPEVAGLAPLGHSSRTADLSLAVARELGLHPHEVAELEYASLVHDIGRITLNEPAILRAGYTNEDIARWGAQIVAEAPHLERVAELVRDQHRPYRRAGQERDPRLPMATKIIKVASAYDQGRHELGLPAVDALEQIHRGSAYEFDPEVAASLRRVLVHRGEIRA